MLPLAARTAESLVNWLAPMAGHRPAGVLGSPAWPGPNGDALRLVPDLDRIDALSGEREALWSRIGAADFLTRDEKRAAVGYGAEGGGGAKTLDIVIHPRHWETQPRVPVGSSDGGQWAAAVGGLASIGDGVLGSLANVTASAVTPLLRAVLQRLITALRGRGGSGSVQGPTPVPKVPGSGSAGRATRDILQPGGVAVGRMLRGAGTEVRTVGASEFRQVKNELLRDAKQVPAPQRYPGTVYERPDGVTFGLRRSNRSGETLEIIDGKGLIKNNFKVHQQ